MQWINNTKTSNLFDALPDMNEEEDKDIYFIKNNEKIENDINTNTHNKIEHENIINIDNKENKEKKKKIKRKMSNLKTTIFEKNPKFKYSDIDIIKNIDDLHREINRFEFTFIDDKELLLNNLKNNYL